MAGAPTPLTLRAGLPFTRRIKVVGGKTLWPSLDALEVEAPLRTGPTHTSALIRDLRPYMAVGYTLDDIVLDWVMSGAQTSELRTGYYAVTLSDVGATDAQAFSILHGRLLVVASERASA